MVFVSQAVQPWGGTNDVDGFDFQLTATHPDGRGRLELEVEAFEAGITAPPNPTHGPWRRVNAQAVEADVRVLPEPGAVLGLATGMLRLRALRRRRKAGL